MIKSYCIILLNVFLIFSCQEEKKEDRIKIEDTLTVSQLETMKELKGFKLGTRYNPETNSNFPYGKHIETSIGGFDGTLNFFTTSQNVIYKMEFVSDNFYDEPNERIQFVNAIKNRFNIPETNQGVIGYDIYEIINGIEYKLSRKLSQDNKFLSVYTFEMTDSKLEEQKDNQNQQKANSDF